MVKKNKKMVAYLANTNTIVIYKDCQRPSQMKFKKGNERPICPKGNEIKLLMGPKYTKFFKTSGVGYFDAANRKNHLFSVNYKNIEDLL